MAGVAYGGNGINLSGVADKVMTSAQWRYINVRRNMADEENEEHLA